MLQALAKDPSQRYQSAAELRHDIQCWLDGFPIVAKSVSSLYLLRKIIARHRYTSTVVALLVVIIFGFSCVYYHLYNSLRESHAQLKQTRQSLSKEIREKIDLALEVVFITHFLEAWENDKRDQAQYIAQHFEKDTREAEAARFLLDPKLSTEKVVEFRNKLATTEPCFTEFIIAEHYRRNNKRAQALRAYRECLSYGAHLKKNKWLEVTVKSRLFELGEKNLQDSNLPKDTEK
jgi:hypothetical protein